MTVRYLLDEHISPSYRTQILRCAPELIVWIIGDPNAPPKGTSDPEILCWCEEHEFILVTNNRRTMPGHLAEHLASGRHIPGIFLIGENMGMGAIIDELLLIAEASLDNEYRDQINFMPLL